MNYNISKGFILSLSSDPKIYKTAEELYKNGHITDINLIHQPKSEIDIVCGKIIYPSTKTFNPMVYFTQSGKYVGHKCTCSSSHIWKGACIHVTVLLFALLYEDFSDFENVRMVKATQNVTNFFEKMLYKNISEEFVQPNAILKKAQLRPHLHKEQGTPAYLTFCVGFDRLYVVKNIKNFIMQVKNESHVQYGKNLEFKHSLSSFEETSAMLIKLLMSFYDAISQLDEISVYSVYRQTNVNLGESFIMPKNFADSFFQIYENKEIYTSVEKTNIIEKFLTQTDDFNKIIFTLTEENENIVLSGEYTSFDYIEGACYYYFFNNNNIIKANKSVGASFLAIQKELSSLKEPTIVFTPKQRPKFFSFVYPSLKSSGLIKNHTNITPPVETKNMNILFYLDIEGKHNYISCRLIFEYGQKDYNPLTDELEQNESRNVYLEARAMNFINFYGFKADKSKEKYYLVQEELIYDFYVYGLESAKKLGTVYATDDFENRKMRRISKGTIRMRINGSLLELTFDLDGLSLNDLMETLSSYSLKKRYHILKDGSFINLEDENIKSCSQILSTLDIKNNDIKNNMISVPKHQILPIEQNLNLMENILFEKEDSVTQLLDDLREFKHLKYAIPKKLMPILRPYQKTGYQWLKTLSHYDFGAILADDMGLGKTLQVITVLLSEKNSLNKPSLVVTPTSLMYNWEHEICKFANEINVIVLAGSPQKRKELLETNNPGGIFITTYDTLKRDLQCYKNIQFEYVIADEAQYIKNPQTQNSIAIKQIDSRVRFALTGTPVENSLSELWNIFDFVLPGYLYNQSKFAATFEKPIIKEDDKQMAKVLQKQIRPFVLRRLKKDVLKELPEKVETTLYSDMENKQREIYIAYLLQAKGEINQAISAGTFEKSKIQILSQLTRLRQICCHPQMFIENYDGGSGKLDLTIETILSAIDSGHRILLFSQFTSMLNIIKDCLSKEGVTFFYLDGGTDARLRKNMADQFNNGEKSVFLISLRAGGTGLNLTGADVVIHYDQWWNPAVMNQAADRAHRYGQKNVVQVINIVTKDTIEEKILELQEKKKGLADAIITEGSNFITKMSADEILQLFNVNTFLVNE